MILKPPYPQTQEGVEESQVDCFSPLVCPELDTVPSLPSFATNAHNVSSAPHCLPNQNVASTFSFEVGSGDLDFVAISSFLPLPDTLPTHQSTLAELPSSDGASATFFDVADSLSMDWLLGSANPSNNGGVEGVATLPPLTFEGTPLSSLPDFAMVVESRENRAPALVPASTGRRRRPKVPVPDDVKQTEKYKQRRAKNNAAAARNREMQRAMVGTRVVGPVPASHQRNLDLRSECDALRFELDALVRVVQTRVLALAP